MIRGMVSVVIVNWNGLKWLKECLDSICSQNYLAIEILVVDNDSKDGSVAFIESKYTDVIVLCNSSNRGFAAGSNSGIRASHGEFILLLNNDISADPDFITTFVKAFTEIPKLGAAQSKIVLLDDPQILDSCGSFWNGSSLLYHYGNGKPESLAIYNRPFPVFSNKGASMLISRMALEVTGLLDEDFWCYYEETDLCHRMWMYGYECWYWPEANIRHAQGGSSMTIDNSYIQFHNFKNKLLSFLKNFETRTLLAIIPIFLFWNLAISTAWLLQGNYQRSWSIYQALAWNLRHLRETMKKRSLIQRTRVRSDADIARIVTKRPRFIYYLCLFTANFSRYVD